MHRNRIYACLQYVKDKQYYSAWMMMCDADGNKISEQLVGNWTKSQTFISTVKMNKVLHIGINPHTEYVIYQVRGMKHVHLASGVVLKGRESSKFGVAFDEVRQHILIFDRFYDLKNLTTKQSIYATKVVL